jgi:hypothetical protein
MIPPRILNMGRKRNQSESKGDKEQFEASLLESQVFTNHLMLFWLCSSSFELPLSEHFSSI